MDSHFLTDERDEVLKQRRSWYVLALGLFVLSLFSRQPLLFLATLFTFLLGFVPDLWYRLALRHLVISQKVDNHHNFFGEEVILSLCIENRKLLPLPWLKVEDRIIPPLVIQSLKATRLQSVQKDFLVGTWLLWSFQRVTRHYRLRCQERGFHTFGPVKLNSSDPFGWLESEGTVSASETLMVYPLLAPLEALGLASLHPSGGSVLPLPLLEDPLRFMGVRDYVPGDDPRRIHWKASAHAGSLECKIYEPPALRRLLVLLDVWNYSTALKGRDQEIQELTIAVAASVAMWGLDEGYMVGVIANCSIVIPPEAYLQTDEQTKRNISANKNEHIAAGVVSVPFASDHGQYERILSLLACLLPQHSSSIGGAIDLKEEMFTRSTTILLVSAATTLNQGTVARLLDMQRRGAAVHLALTGDPSWEVETETYNLPVHYPGGKEKWHELINSVGAENSGAVGTGSTGLQLD